MYRSVTVFDNACQSVDLAKSVSGLEILLKTIENLITQSSLQK